jgi:hypothetical protein
MAGENSGLAVGLKPGLVELGPEPARSAGKIWAHRSAIAT